MINIFRGWISVSLPLKMLMTETKFTWDVWFFRFLPGIGTSWKVDELLIPECSTARLSHYLRITLGVSSITFLLPGSKIHYHIMYNIIRINITWVLKSHYFTCNSGAHINVHNLPRRVPGILAVIAVPLSLLLQTRHCGEDVQTLTVGYCQLVHIPVVTEVFQERIAG